MCDIASHVIDPWSSHMKDGLDWRFRIVNVLGRLHPLREELRLPIIMKSPIHVILHADRQRNTTQRIHHLHATSYIF